MTGKEFDTLINDVCEKKKINSYQLAMICNYVNGLRDSNRAIKSYYMELCQFLKERDLFKDVIKWRKEKNDTKRKI